MDRGRNPIVHEEINNHNDTNRSQNNNSALRVNVWKNFLDKTSDC